MEIALPQVLENMAAHLAEADVSVSSISSLLGPIGETYSGSGYYLVPADKRFSSIWIGINVDKNGTVVSDVDLELRPHTLEMAELDKKFGPHAKVAPAPNGPLYRVRYRYERDDKPYSVPIFATLSGNPAPASPVEKIMLRRDKR
jgi:hypothetical protein